MKINILYLELVKIQPQLEKIQTTLDSFATKSRECFEQDDRKHEINDDNYVEEPKDNYVEQSNKDIAKEPNDHVKEPTETNDTLIEQPTCFRNTQK